MATAMITTSKAIDAIEIPAICAVVRGTGYECCAGRLVAEALWGALLVVDVAEGTVGKTDIVAVNIMLGVVLVRELLDCVDVVDVVDVVDAIGVEVGVEGTIV